MNNVSLTGRITKDPELRFSQNGHACVMFTLAVERKYKDQSGERPTDFINCVAWNNQAEFIHNYVKKGNMLEVTGAIQTRSYEAQNGDTKYITEVILDSVSNLTPKPKEDTPQNESQYFNDDLPF